MLLTRSLNTLFSPGGRRAKLSTLIFHRVLPECDPLFPDEPDAERFREILTWVRKSFNVLPLEGAINRLNEGTLPPRALAITFDDGYADNCEVAMPILSEFGMTATFFIASDFLDGGRMWNDSIIESIRRAENSHLDLSDIGMGKHDLSSVQKRRLVIDSLISKVKYLPPVMRSEAVDELVARSKAKLPSDLMMTSNQVCELRNGGMSIGGHTCSHPILARLDDSAARDEIVNGKDRLEGILGETIRTFAYPNGKPGGDFIARDVRLVKEAGYTAAVTTSPGVGRTDSDPFQIPRFTPWDRTQLRFGARMASNMLVVGETAG